METQLPVESAAPARDIIPEPQPEQTVAAPEPAVNSLPQPLVPDMEPAPEKSNVVKEPTPVVPPMEKNAPPDAAKQQLMQSAGKILRQ